MLPGFEDVSGKKKISSIRSLNFLFPVIVILPAVIFEVTYPGNYILAGSLFISLIFLSLRRKKEYHLEITRREKQYATLIENMNDGLMFLNNQNELRFVNDRFCEITGYKRAELIGKNILELKGFSKKNSPAYLFAEQLKPALTGNVRCECILEKKGGKKAWVGLSGMPIYDDIKKRTGSMVVFNDITVLKDIEEQLKKKEEGYRTFIDQSAVGIWRAEYKQPVSIHLPIEKQVDLLLNTGRISECNEAMARMYGYECPQQLVGRRIKDFYLIENKFDETQTHVLLTSFIQNNYRLTNEESKETDKHGNVRYILNNNTGIVEKDFLVRTWGVQTDITERKKIESELQKTNQELDTFFYKASHDLKGPLASIRGIINLARIENKYRLTGQAMGKDQIVSHALATIEQTALPDYFEMIEGSVMRLDNTLMDLIELARMRQGAYKITSINVKELTDEILKSLSYIEGFNKIAFEVHIDSTIIISADKVLMISVFQNLIHNAINYSNKLKAGILIHVRETDTGIELEVTDNGKGIAENIKNKIFDMFYRGQPDSGGSGLGLFIVKSALDKMQGKINFESEPGKGTSFFVEIPNATVEVLA